MKTSTLAMALALVATPALATTEAVMHRDPGCGCCVKWAEQVRKSFGRSVRIVDDANRPALQRRVGLQRAQRGHHRLGGQAHGGLLEHLLASVQAALRGR